MQSSPVGTSLLSILFGVSLTAVTCLAIGTPVLQFLKIRLYREERWPFAFVTGAALLSGIVFSLGILRLIYPATLIGVSILSIGLCFLFKRQPSGDLRLPTLRPYLRILFIAGFVAYSVLYVRYALAPEASPDGMMYHLSLTSRYFAAHGIIPITTTFYATLSQGMEMLFLFAFAFGKHSAAATVHYLVFLCLPLLILLYARRFGMAPAGVFGALLVFAAPVMGIDGTSTYIDCALACAIFAAFYALEIWGEQQQQGALILAGLFCGFSFAIKFTAVSAIAGALAYVVWRKVQKHDAGIARACCLLLAAAAPLAIVWPLRNWVFVDNPLAPFGNAIFPNPYLHVSFERDYRYVLSRRGDFTFWNLPLEVTVRGGRLGGLIGPAFLAAPIAILALREWRGRRILIAGAIAGFGYLFNKETRFIIPSLPFLALAMGLALARVPALLCLVAVAQLILCWPTVVKRYAAPGAWRLQHVPWSAVLRTEKGDAYLYGRTAEYRLARMVEAAVPPGEPVFSFGGIAQSYTSHVILVSFQSAFNERLRSVLCVGYEPDSCQPLLTIRFSFPPAKVRHLRVVQLAKGESDSWSISEIHVANSSTPIPVDSNWRVSASPNPWDAGLAVDGSPVTRWSTWESFRPSMFFEIDMNRPRLIDSVGLDGPGAQWESRLKLEGSPDGLHWTLLSTTSSLEKNPLIANYRRLAALEVKRMGVSYIMVKKSEEAFKDFNDHPSEWGITLVAGSADGKLYRID